MNDIYEYKARKYKHKYLKLKREYIAKGGAFNKIKKFFKNNTMGYRIGIDYLMEPRDQSKPIDHSQSASAEQKKLKTKLKYLRQEIKLYMDIPNLIYGNIYYKDMFYHFELESGKYTPSHFNNFIDFNEIENVRLIIDDNRRLIFRGKKRINLNIPKIFISPGRDSYMSYIYGLERRSGGREEKRRVTTISRVRKFEVEYRNIFQRVEKVKTETTVSVQKYP